MQGGIHLQVYLVPLFWAVIIFPIIAVILTIPYLLYNYRKFGSIIWFKVFIVFSFIYYLLNVYFLVILPLPNAEEILLYANKTMIQLKPFNFVNDFYRETSFNISDISTYFPSLTARITLITFFNLIMFMPLGIYLRYYFKIKFIMVFVISLGLSLFLEITQLTGIYGIYPYAYRLFDVDDLIINTLGSVIGYIITPLITFMLPTREILDEKAYRNGEKVPLTRRLVAFGVDTVLILISSVIFSLFTFTSFMYNYIGAIIIFTIFLPLKNNENTLGQNFMKFKMENIHLVTLIIRNLVLYFILLPLPFYIFILFANLIGGNFITAILYFGLTMIGIYLLMLGISDRISGFLENITKIRIINQITLHEYTS